VGDLPFDFGDMIMTLVGKCCNIYGFFAECDSGSADSLSWPKSGLAKLVEFILCRLARQRYWHVPSPCRSQRIVTLHLYERGTPNLLLMQGSVIFKMRLMRTKTKTMRQVG
jgi:hypothetical protein